GERVRAPRPAGAVSVRGVGAAGGGGGLCLWAGAASLCGEPLPPGLLSADATLSAPPAPLPPSDLLPAQVPAAWGGDGTTTAAALADALSAKAGRPLPWPTVRAALTGAFQGRLLERAVGRGPWPCHRAGAAAGPVQVPGRKAGGGTATPDVVVPPEPPPRPGVRVARADLRPNQLQDLADQVGELTRLAVGFDLKLSLTIELG